MEDLGVEARFPDRVKKMATVDACNIWKAFKNILNACDDVCEKKT